MRGYETRDLRFSAIATALATLGLVLAAVALVCSATLRRLSTPAFARPHALPPEPRLQADAAADQRLMREEEDAVLNGYGWVDRPKGVIRLPIDRAMDVLVRHGLPSRALPPERRP